MILNCIELFISVEFDYDASNDVLHNILLVTENAAWNCWWFRRYVLIWCKHQLAQMNKIPTRDHKQCGGSRSTMYVNIAGNLNVDDDVHDDSVLMYVGEDDDGDNGDYDWL